MLCKEPKMYIRWSEDGKEKRTELCYTITLDGQHPNGEWYAFEIQSKKQNGDLYFRRVVIPSKHFTIYCI